MEIAAYVVERSLPAIHSHEGPSPSAAVNHEKLQGAAVKTVSISGGPRHSV